MDYFFKTLKGNLAVEVNNVLLQSSQLVIYYFYIREIAPAAPTLMASVNQITLSHILLSLLATKGEITLVTLLIFH